MTEKYYKAWKPLQPGAIVDLIAPAGRCATEALAKVDALLRHWQLIPRRSPKLLGEDLLCANNDAERFNQLKQALCNTDSSAVWCLRGGYGCTRLIPNLLTMPPPTLNKLFIGFSDITTLHLFLQQHWCWQTLHGPSANQVAQGHIDDHSIDELKQLIFGQLPQLTFELNPLNTVHSLPSTHQTNEAFATTLTGGTLTLVQASLGTSWQIETKNKILFLEEVNEAPYRVDRMLQHLQQSTCLSELTALIFGDFITIANQQPLMDAVLQRFAQTLPIPVFSCPGIGHGKTNRSLVFGAPVHLERDKHQLTIQITS
jgi:muramoyltetrapeptide carboxypeptidase